MDLVLYIIVAVAALTVGVLATYLFLKKRGASKLASAEAEAKQILETAIRTAETRKKEALLEAKEESLRLKNDADAEIKERRREISRQEHRLAQKEENLDGKLERMEKKEVALAEIQGSGGQDRRGRGSERDRDGQTGEDLRNDERRSEARAAR